ncbi:secretory carrier-associated membrane protein 1-like [Musca domestica]|uniref:Secretory carrier-associated membrane protein n=1 Tax=Musca domestica TaxID=7370 RepID=A0A1I8NE54_MUSDO|nr:secretory carrier-associated membrane protein 1 [Musca domestica]XP_058983648.1 secretory carrier-associated membrane protein 1-like [Musca domestica]
MSGFDDNPFGEPNLDNPFADPAIQQATRTTTNVQSSLEDYNPFEQEQSKPQLNINSTINSNAAVVQPLSQNLPPAQQRAPAPTASTSIQITTEELQRRQEELDRKAAELDRREQQLQGNVPQLNNWPPLPDNFCVKPCFYQDFNLEIPPEFQRLVKHLYYTWMFYTLTMCVNIIGGLAILLHTGDFTNFGLSIFYTLLFTPASYICWFRPAYKAFRNDSSFNFMVFFFVYFFQTLFSVFQAIGFPKSGYCGFIVAISQFKSSAADIVVGLFLLCIAFCFAVTAAANIMMITKIHSIYRSSGASMAKAQAEFATEFMRNQHVQEATATAVNSAINSQFNNRRY